ncbi:UDP-glycosyltransferase UGT5-like [Phlebotomus argentipes]|uniref:UDP-glycosyltransferase UGT5-like n=1 Tax=Phlebotomus argentipes TaxID=94469 RepID=UPI002892C203|nr:UDP-glycosyltransferase UGT5-like [Phlebotomus argentipes]
MRITFFLLAVFLPLGLTHRILGIFPLGAKSHDILYQSIAKELAERGHEVTVIRSLAASPDTPQGYRELLLSNVEPIVDSFNLNDSFAPSLWNVYRDFSGLIEMSERVCTSLLESSALSDVLTIHKETPFDLVLIELFATDCPLGIANEMNLTTIGISPCALMPWHYDRFNLMDFPSFVPTESSPFATKMTFWERVENYLIGKVMKILFRKIQEQDNAILKAHFGRHPRDVDGLAREIALALVNQHFSVSGVKPLNPRVVEIGGAHIKYTEGGLAEDVDAFLTSSPTAGVIYINWGSVVRSSSLPESHLQALRSALGRLPMHVVWKWESGVPFVNKSERILVKSWLPQLQILCHPKTVLFLTHGGLLSANEAAFCGTPVIVTPIFGDQHLNGAALVERGMGILLPLDDFSEDTIYARLTEILKPQYQRQAEQVRLQFRDRLMNPLDTAIWWIEHIAAEPAAAELLRTLPVDLNYMKSNNFQDLIPLIWAAFATVIGFCLLVLVAIPGFVRKLKEKFA